MPFLELLSRRDADARSWFTVVLCHRLILLSGNDKPTRMNSAAPEPHPTLRAA